MGTSTTITTQGLEPAQRISLIRDAADRLFNLETDLRAVPAAGASAHIEVIREGALGLAHVRTSHSTVSRSLARSSAADRGNLMLYAVDHGGSSSFENARGEQFRTRAGSLFVGSQDAVYRAQSAHGAAWNFRAFTMPEHLFPQSRTLIRDGGFRLLHPAAPFHGVLVGLAEQLSLQFGKLPEDRLSEAMGAVDHLVACGLGGPVHRHPALVASVAAQRRRAALEFAVRELGSHRLTPARIAKHLNLSVRQLQRAFEPVGTSLSDEISCLRLDRARQLLAQRPDMPVTHVAMAAGFDSLATFYRLFKAGFGMTATDWRESAACASSAAASSSAGAPSGTPSGPPGSGGCAG